MKILRICQETPYPPSDGVRIEPYHITRHMAARGHEITLVCFQTDSRDVTPLEQWCELYTVPFAGRNSLANIATGVVERFPVNYVKYRDKQLLSIAQKLLDTRPFDVIVVDYSALGWFALQLKKQYPEIPVVTRWPNFDTLVWERWTANQGSVIKRKLGELQTGFIRNFEAELASASDLCLTIGARDTELLRELAPDARVEFLPAGIDIDHYSYQVAPESKNLLFMSSSYKWHANWDSVKWLHDEIMPRIWQKHPGTILYITGADHTPEMQSWTADGRVVLTGFVPDEREIAAKCRILVVPMRLGAGIKLKILTAFAMGKAVVTTSQGAEGVAGLADGKHCLVRDSVDEFADAVNELLDDDSLLKFLAENGRSMVCNDYDWEAVSAQFESLLNSVVAQRTRPVMAGAAGTAS
jgi:glycosyltransferase involved in cell wall biosynthesis